MLEASILRAKDPQDMHNALLIAVATQLSFTSKSLTAHLSLRKRHVSDKKLGNCPKSSLHCFWTHPHLGPPRQGQASACLSHTHMWSPLPELSSRGIGLGALCKLTGITLTVRSDLPFECWLPDKSQACLMEVNPKLLSAPCIPLQQ
eukprot:3808389-Amphidinium_carterae.1